jgi:hypothetical protein
MGRKHPLADLLGEGIVTGLSLYAVWRWLVRPLGRGLGHLSWRWRRFLGPLWVATGVELAALLWRALAPAWWPLALVLPASGVALALAGPHLSEKLSGTTLALVPDSLRAGRKGVLDRPAERLYLAGLLAYVGCWLALRVGTGASAITEWTWLAGWAGFGGVWWWHRRIRVAGRADRYARRWRKLVDPAKVANPKFKPLHGSKVVGATGTRRGLCTLTVKLAHGHTGEDVVPILRNIASWYHLRPNAVTLAEDETNSSRVVLRFLPRDPWKGKLAHPSPAVGTYTLASLQSRLPVGVLASGATLVWRLQHALMVGRTGSGKSVLLESVLRWLTGATDAVVIGADLASGATLGVWRRCLALPLAEDFDSTCLLIAAAMRVVEDRERRLGVAKEADDEAGDSFEDDPGVPWLFVVIDEYPDWVAEAQQTPAGRRYLALVGRLAKRGRKAKVRLVLAAQNGSKADTGSKELQGQLTSLFGLALAAHPSKVAWGELGRQGWSSLGLREGQFLLNDPEHQVPEVAKGFWSSVRERREWVNAAAALATVLEPSAQAALLDTTDAEVAAGAIVPPAPPTDPYLDALAVEAARAEDLAVRVGVSRATAFRRLNALKARGLVVNADGVWSLVRAEQPIS